MPQIILNNNRSNNNALIMNDYENQTKGLDTNLQYAQKKSDRVVAAANAAQAMFRNPKFKNSKNMNVHISGEGVVEYNKEADDKITEINSRKQDLSKQQLHTETLDPADQAKKAKYEKIAEDLALHRNSPAAGAGSGAGGTLPTATATTTSGTPTPPSYTDLIKQFDTKTGKGKSEKTIDALTNESTTNDTDVRTLQREAKAEKDPLLKKDKYDQIAEKIWNLKKDQTVDSLQSNESQAYYDQSVKMGQQERGEVAIGAGAAPPAVAGTAAGGGSTMKIPGKMAKGANASGSESDGGSLSYQADPIKNINNQAGFTDVQQQDYQDLNAMGDVQAVNDAASGDVERQGYKNRYYDMAAERLKSLQNYDTNALKDGQSVEGGKSSINGSYNDAASWSKGQSESSSNGTGPYDKYKHGKLVYEIATTLNGTPGAPIEAALDADGNVNFTSGADLKSNMFSWNEAEKPSELRGKNLAAARDVVRILKGNPTYEVDGGGATTLSTEELAKKYRGVDLQGGVIRLQVPTNGAPYWEIPNGAKIPNTLLLRLGVGASGNAKP